MSIFSTQIDHSVNPKRPIGLKKIMNKNTISNFSILIVEDDLPFALELDMLIRKIGYTVKGRVDNSAEALEILLVDPPDLVLMDIQIKGRLNGVELAEKVKETNVPFLFISSVQEEKIYERARNTNFVGYLVKPVNKFSIRTAVDLAVQHVAKNKNIISSKGETYCAKGHLFFKKKNIIHKVAIVDIRYIQVDGNLTIIHTKEQTYYSFVSLKAFLDLLIDFSFVQVHRSYIVNLNKATSIDLDNQWLSLDGEKIPVSRRKKAELLKFLPSV